LQKHTPILADDPSVPFSPPSLFIVRSLLTCADVPTVFVLEVEYDLPSLCDPVMIVSGEMMRL
jgi:hypothetical protein